jgi:DNA-directed RNA polymerase specialized sigma24 family protein
MDETLERQLQASIQEALKDHAAWRQVFQVAYTHLQDLVRRLLNSFPDLKHRHDQNSVIDELWPELISALETYKPQDARAILGLTKLILRRLLIDMVRKQRRIDQRERQDLDDGSVNLAANKAARFPDPAKLAELAEFFEQVEKLPAELRAVAELHIHGGFSGVQVAAALEISPKVESNRWIAARRLLGKWLDSERNS